MERVAFISSTSEDLTAHRRAAAEACLRAGYRPKMMEGLPARAISPTLVDREMVVEADVFLCILGWRYGSSPAGSRNSFTEMEFDHALERGLPILLFLVAGERPVPSGLREETEEAQVRLQAFKDRARQGRVLSWFRDPEVWRRVSWPGSRDISRKPVAPRNSCIPRRRSRALRRPTSPIHTRSCKLAMSSVGRLNCRV